MKNILDGFKVPYWVMNSSFKGFHIHIPQEFMPKFNQDTLRNIGEVLYNIKGIEDFQTLDISIGDNKRLCKVCYSPVSDGSICLPLIDEQIDNFKLDIVKISNVLRTCIIKNRGLLLRTHNLSEEELKKNVLCFLKEYSES